MRNLIVAVLSLAVFSCCTSVSQKVDEDKKYLYIEVTGDRPFGEYRTTIDTVEIIAKNDSVAYLEAFEKSCISQQASVIVAAEMKKRGGTMYENDEIIHDFRLLDENLIEVKQNVVPDSVLIEIARSIFSITTD